MKRRAALLRLSREHHAALVLTQRIERAGDAAATGALMASVPAIFRCELDPHFRAEESTLLPRLHAAGETELVERTLEDHGELRRLAASIAAGDTSVLKPFGVALRAHVRFEERELFPAAETVLPTGLLDDPEPWRDPDCAGPATKPAGLRPE